MEIISVLLSAFLWTAPFVFFVIVPNSVFKLYTYYKLTHFFKRRDKLLVFVSFWSVIFIILILIYLPNKAFPSKYPGLLTAIGFFIVSSTAIYAYYFKDRNDIYDLYHKLGTKGKDIANYIHEKQYFNVSLHYSMNYTYPTKIKFENSTDEFRKQVIKELNEANIFKEFDSPVIKKAVLIELFKVVLGIGFFGIVLFIVN